jgi:hypothetical protein
MSILEHKEAHEISGAIANHIKSASANSQHGALLIDVYKAARTAAATDKTDPAALNHVRRSLCSLCRGHELYKCDVAEGWSQECAFLQKNN